MEMSRDREHLLHQHSLEKEEMMLKFTAERDKLNATIACALRDRDDKLMEAERDKQQVCCFVYCSHFFSAAYQMIAIQSVYCQTLILLGNGSSMSKQSLQWVHRDCTS